MKIKTHRFYRLLLFTAAFSLILKKAGLPPEIIVILVAIFSISMVDYILESNEEDK